MSNRCETGAHSSFGWDGGLRLKVSAALLMLLAGTAVGYGQSAGLDSFLDELMDDSSLMDEGDGPRGPVDLSYLEDKVKVNEYDIVDLHVNNEDLGNVLQLLSLQSQRNIVASNNVSATVTADLYNVTFEEALNAILHVNGYGWVQKGNFIYVYTAEELTAIEQASRRRISRVINLDYLNAVDAASFVQPLLSADGKITANSAAGPFNIGSNSPVGADEYASNAMIVIFDFEENVEQIAELVASLDTKPVQVLVEATILQTALNEANAFGVDFSIISNMDFTEFMSNGPLGVVDDLIGGIGSTLNGGGQTDVRVPVDGKGSAVNTAIGAVRDPGGLKAGFVGNDVAVFLRLLDEVTDVTVISNPKILTLNRQPARVLVGTKVGYLQTTTTDTSTTQSVEFLDTGTQLNLRPFVSADGIIRMELKPQVSSFRLRNTTDSTGATITIPDEDTSELVTNVMVRDGQTVVLGGLFTETTTATRRQVPGLGDIPVIGMAFQGNDDTTRRSEIIFMITPSIINDHMLSLQGDRANEYVDGARAGARAGTLGWSRDRRVSRLLIEARKDAEAGNRESALFKVRRALTLHPQSNDARRMLDQLTSTDTWPTRSMLEDVMHNELQLPPSSAQFAPATFQSNVPMNLSNSALNQGVTDWLLAGEQTTIRASTTFNTASSQSNTSTFETDSASSATTQGTSNQQFEGSTQVSADFDSADFADTSTFDSTYEAAGNSSESFEPVIATADTSNTETFDSGMSFENGFAGEQQRLDEPSTHDATPTQGEGDFANSWGDFSSVSVGPDMVPVFIPMHGGLYWLPMPRGLFSVQQVREAFGDGAVTNVPTDNSDLAE